MKHRALALCVTAALAAAAAAAQEAPPATASPAPPDDVSRLPIVVEKIVVSATVAEEGRDAATLSSWDAAEIARRNRGQDLAMLLAETPGAYAYSDSGNGVGYAYLSLRGFDQRRIAVYVNGVPLNEPESQQVYFIDLADMASGLSAIQVQRGTATALYGSPAVGGLVNLETGALATQRGGELTLGAGSFGSYRGSLRWATPLGERSALSLRLAHVRSDGYREPAWTRHGLGHASYQRLGNDSVLRITAFGGPEKTQLAYLGVPIEQLQGGLSGDADRDRRLNPLVPGETDHFLQPHLQVLHDRRLREGLLLKNGLYAVFGSGYFRQYSPLLGYDPLGSAPPTDAFPERAIADAWRRRSIDNRRFGWIPSLAWDHGRGRLTAGFELQWYGGHHRGRVQEGSDCVAAGAEACEVAGAPLASELTLYDYRTRKTTASAFARESLALGDRLRLNLELQATRHGFSTDDDAVRGYSWDSSYGFVTPRVGLAWSDGSWTSYASFSTARSEPRFADVWDMQDPYANPFALFDSADASGLHFQDARARSERLRAVELGGGWSGPRGRVRANLYWMDFRDELVYAGGIDDDGLPITDNAAHSLHRGVELDATLALPAAFELSGHVAASQDRLEDYRLQFGPAATDVVDYSGNRIALFPTHQARALLARGFGPLRLGFGLRRVGTIYLDNSENERKDPAARSVPGYVDKRIHPFTLGELRAELDLRRVLGGTHAATLRLNVENLFDERYAASGYAYGIPYFIPGASRNVYLGLTYGF